MQWGQDGNSFIVYVEKNEKIMDSITQFCVNKQIHNGFISGIGAIKSVELGAFDIDNKTYIRKHIDAHLELTSFQGNITLKDGKPFIHAHITVGDHEMKIMSGHLFEATVAAVGEFSLEQRTFDASRKLNEDVGLPCICLSETF